MSNVVYAFPTDEELEIVAFVSRFGFYFEDVQKFVDNKYPQLEGEYKQHVIEVFQILKEEQDRYFTHRDNKDTLINMCRIMGFIKEGEKNHKPFPLLDELGV